MLTRNLSKAITVELSILKVQETGRPWEKAEKGCSVFRPTDGEKKDEVLNFSQGTTPHIAANR